LTQDVINELIKELTSKRIQDLNEDPNKDRNKKLIKEVNKMKDLAKASQEQVQVLRWNSAVNTAQTKKKVCLTLLLAFCPGLSAWAGGQITEVPVISSYPVYQTVVREVPREQCHIEQVARRHSGHKSATPAIVGTIIGGALGNAVGSKKKNKQVGAVVGGVLGYSIGRDIGRRGAERQAAYGYEDREVCSTIYERVEEERLNGYDVSYAYAGETYKTRMASDPGDTIRVRVQVRPL
jgi:uncharacterized protein YcfJ